MKEDDKQAKRARFNRIMAGVFDQVLKEMSIDVGPIDFVEESTRDIPNEAIAILDAMPDAELAKECRKMAISCAPTKYLKRLPS